MQILEQIKNINHFSKEETTEIQKLCLQKLQLNPLPNTNSELWRLSNKSKFNKSLNYSFNNNYSQLNIPVNLFSRNILRLIIGKEEKINLNGEKYKIKELSEKEIINLIKKHILNTNNEENWINLLNHCLSFKNNILALSISGNEIPPLEIFSSSNIESFNAKTLILFIEKDTKVNLLQINLGSEDSTLSQSTYLFLEENSLVNHGVVSYGKEKSHLLNSLNVKQKRSSEYNLGSLQFKYNFARFEIAINQIEGNAKTNIKGMQISKNNDQISTYTKITFNGPNGFLDQINKSLADDKSHSVFDGLISVPKIAQKTDASQLSRNLLLSKYAKIDTKPQLEIIADDVKCKHGATITQLNSEELFYMRSRGLTLEEASKLQLSSYYQEIISFLPISKERWDLLDHLLKK